MAEGWAALETLEGPRRAAMAFLRERLPASDLDGYPFSLFLRFADHALRLRETVPLCRALDWEIFCHYVLFPRVNDEDLSFHRALFYDALSPRLAGLGTAEAMALEVNRWCHEQAGYQSQDARTASPLTVYRCGSGRCGEESAFLVSALRSVGLAARQVYAPRWSHCDDNHAWAEVLCGGTWRFLGACEPEPELDRGWFNGAAAQAMLVRSRLFGPGASPLHGAFLGREGKLFCYNQTARYAPTAEYRFRALLNGRPAPGAVFRLQILNEACYETIAVLTAGGDGEARASLGRGSLHVLAMLDGYRAEGDCRGGGELTLALAAPETGDSPWRETDFVPPPPAPPEPGLPPELKARRREVLRRGEALRAAKLAGFFDPAWKGTPWAAMLKRARGNAGEIAAFLRKDGDPRREKLLRSLTGKDLRDVSAGLLEAHLAALPERGELPEDVYWQALACPRAATEPLSPWRGRLKAALTERERERFRREPALLWEKLRASVRMTGEDACPTLYWTAEAALAAGRCDEKSLRLLFTLLLRDLGVPARLRAADGEPEVWRDGAFHPLRREETGTLRLHWRGEGPPPRCRQGWSLARQTERGWLPLALPPGGWERGTLTLTLPAGRYRLTATLRLPSGEQLACLRELALAGGACREEELRQRRCETARLLFCRTLPPLAGLRPGPALLLWLEPGREPTEHLLAELAALDPPFPLPLRAFAEEAGALGELPLLAGDPADAEALARRLNCPPGVFPLAALLDGAGRARCAAAGYRVGLAELLARLARAMGEEASPPPSEG